MGALAGPLAPCMNGFTASAFIKVKDHFCYELTAETCVLQLKKQSLGLHLRQQGVPPLRMQSCTGRIISEGAKVHTFPGHVDSQAAMAQPANIPSAENPGNNERKTSMIKGGATTRTGQTGCTFWLLKKRRFCTNRAKPGHSFCGNHLPDAALVKKRVPCPADPSQ
jgi:hypothetical protein